MMTPVKSNKGSKFYQS